MEQKRAGCMTVLVACTMIGLVMNRCSDKPKGEPIPTPAPSPMNPHEQRLAELRKKREGLSVSMAIEIEMGKSLSRDAMKLSMEPFPDPDERQFLMDKMDEQRKRAAQLLAELQGVNADIAKEEGRLPTGDPILQPPQPAPDSAQQSANPQPPTETIPSASSTETPKPTSGVLCNETVAVPQNGELTFKALPGERLKFTFDHEAWSPSIHRQPDGTQTLVMRSIKPGIQTECDMRWEVAP